MGHAIGTATLCSYFFFNNCNLVQFNKHEFVTSKCLFLVKNVHTTHKLLVKKSTHHTHKRTCTHG